MNRNSHNSNKNDHTPIIGIAGVLLLFVSIVSVFLPRYIEQELEDLFSSFCIMSFPLMIIGGGMCNSGKIRNQILLDKNKYWLRKFNYKYCFFCFVVILITIIPYLRNENIDYANSFIILSTLWILYYVVRTISHLFKEKKSQDGTQLLIGSWLLLSAELLYFWRSFTTLIIVMNIVAGAFLMHIVTEEKPQNKK